MPPAGEGEAGDLVDGPGLARRYESIEGRLHLWLAIIPSRLRIKHLARLPTNDARDLRWASAAGWPERGPLPRRARTCRGLLATRLPSFVALALTTLGLSPTGLYRLLWSHNARRHSCAAQRSSRVAAIRDHESRGLLYGLSLRRGVVIH